MCNTTGDPVEQTLSVGSTSDCDIQMGSDLAKGLQVQYYLNGHPVAAVTNVGEYTVELKWKDDAEYAWLNSVDMPTNITLEIKQKTVELVYDETKVSQLTKQYDGLTDWDPSEIYDCLLFTDKAGFTISYSDVLNANNRKLMLINMKAYISQDGKDNKTSQANLNANDSYNLYVYDFDVCFFV